MHVTPIAPRETAVDACARALRSAILRGELQPGDRLPPERRLAESFGVNRVTVRGALGQLAAAELVRVRQGSGYVVRDFRATGGPALIGELAAVARTRGDLPELIADLLHVRRHLASAVLERLVERGGSVELEPVEAAIDQLAQAADEGVSAEAFADADLAVLGALLEATGSTVLGLCLNPVVRVVGALPELRAAMYARPEENVAGWRMLAAGLEASRAGAPVDATVVLRALAARDAMTLTRVRERVAAEETPS